VVAAADGAAAMGFGGIQSAAMRVVAIVDLARSDYELAYRALRPLVDNSFVHVWPLSFPDFVEAAVRTSRASEAVDIAAELGRRATLSGSTWARGVAERTRALVSDDHDAE
jgi:hypothetical protein